MGQVCAKNDAGKVATDAPKPSIQRAGNKQLISSQKPTPAAAPATETKFVISKINFNTDKTVQKKPGDIAREVAIEWCNENAEWEYTGNWKNERSTENSAVELSHFEVRKKAQPNAANANVTDDVKPVVMVTDDKIDESGKRPAVDQK